MNIEMINTEGQTEMKVMGRVDTVTSPAFLEQMSEIMEKYPQNVLVDCEELTFLSSAGLRAFFVLVKKAKAEKAEISLKNLNENVREVFQISGFDSFLNIID